MTLCVLALTTNHSATAAANNIYENKYLKSKLTITDSLWVYPIMLVKNCIFDFAPIKFGHQKKILLGFDLNFQ